MTEPSHTTETLWHLLSDRLRVFLRRRVSDEQTAEDLLQETFVRIHRRIHQTTEQRLVPWVFAIARNLVVDHYRARDKQRHTPEVEKTQSDVGTENLNQEVADWLIPMIAALPEEYREAIEKYELRGHSQQTIADDLGLSLSGAKSRIQRGRKLLRERLLACCRLERDHYGNIVDYTQNSQDDCHC